MVLCTRKHALTFTVNDCKPGKVTGFSTTETGPSVGGSVLALHIPGPSLDERVILLV
ncbi:hypothetical protein NQZ68_028646 [Dissostichus eleginoides]|nr:hypothetical protein NQZ68_028646 [Dissostichus eleginoides]